MKESEKLTPRERKIRANEQAVRDVVSGEISVPGLPFGDPDEDWEHGRPRARFRFNFMVNFLIYFVAFAGLIGFAKWVLS